MSIVAAFLFACFRFSADFSPERPTAKGFVSSSAYTTEALVPFPTSRGSR